MPDLKAAPYGTQKVWTLDSKKIAKGARLVDTWTIRLDSFNEEANEMGSSRYYYYYYYYCSYIACRVKSLLARP